MQREVQLKPTFADEYPALSPHRWYTAAAVAGLIKARRILEAGPEVKLDERVLSPAHFTFRGGSPRQGGWVGVRTRRVDRHPSVGSGRWR